jgi:hypothetical protein
MVQLSIPKRTWSSISIELIAQLTPSAKGNDAIMVVKICAIRNKTIYTAEDFAKLFVNRVYCSHGLLPLEMISDGDTKITSEFRSDIMKLLNVKRGMSTSYHPRSNGETGRTNNFRGGPPFVYIPRSK